MTTNCYNHLLVINDLLEILVCITIRLGYIIILNIFLVTINPIITQQLKYKTIFQSMLSIYTG